MLNQVAEICYLPRAMWIRFWVQVLKVRSAIAPPIVMTASDHERLSAFLRAVTIEMRLPSSSAKNSIVRK